MAAEARKEEEPEEDPVFKTKKIKFHGRTVPIILQNDNGPCPLLAICNALLLKNLLVLNEFATEVKFSELVTHLLGRILDSDRYQELSSECKVKKDFIGLLSGIGKGLNVDIRFKSVTDFVKTRERELFDLLDIPLYHGWIVDPEDKDTAKAIGSMSYNSLMLIPLKNMEADNKSGSEVDSVAVATGSLAVPSQSFARAGSFAVSSRSNSHHKKERKGDLEEEEALRLALYWTRVDSQTSLDKDLIDEKESDASVHSNECTKVRCFESGVLVDALKGIPLDEHRYDQSDLPVFQASNTLSSCTYNTNTSVEINPSFLYSAGDSRREQLSLEGSVVISSDSSFFTHNQAEHQNGHNRTILHGPSEGVTSSIDINEPMYEGKDHIFESRITSHSREPTYEGEVVLTEQSEKDTHPIDETTPRNGALIKNFLASNASQLTRYGLFQLQRHLKEQEVCVFFRNNHFNTMFKFRGELYLLVNDQGYIDQPGVVWEKFNEVNGDTVFMTGDFVEFKVENHIGNTWDERKAMTTTTDYLAGFDKSSSEESLLNPDLQFAIALQHQEFENQQQLISEQSAVRDSLPSTDLENWLTGSWEQRVESKGGVQDLDPWKTD